MLDIHRSKCPHSEELPRLQISCDGVSESKSTSVSLDVYSARSTNCQVTYPYCIVRPNVRFSGVENREKLGNFIEDVSTEGKIVQFIGDNPKRAIARDSLSHSSNYPCEYCFKKGTRLNVNENSVNTCQKLKELKLQKDVITEKLHNSPHIDNVTKCNLHQLLTSIADEEKNLHKSKSQTVWPASTSRGEPRTRQKILDILQRMAESDTILPADVTKGIVRRSFFLDLPDFDFVKDIPCDYLHAICCLLYTSDAADE